MTTNRVMNGVQNFEHTKLGTLAIGAMVRRNPEPVYESECRCGAKSTVTQRELRNNSARCRAAGCGKTPAPDKSRATELARQAQQREAEAQRLRDEASAARMNAETSDHKVTSSRPPVSDDPGPMRERDRISLRALKEEESARERAEKEAELAPIREAQEKLNQTHRELARVERERLEATVKDPDLFSDPVLRGVSMGETEADSFNRNEFQRFRSSHPDVYISTELVDSLGRYFVKNGQALVSAAMLDKAVSRFRDAGLLPEKPTPEVKTSPIPRKTTETPRPVTYEGVDLESGEPRTYSEREVSRMSSDHMKRALRLTKDRLILPNVGPGPKGLRSI